MRPALAPFVVAAFCAAAADASFAFRGVLASHSSFGAALASFTVAAAVVACPLLLASVSAGIVWGRVRGAGDEIRGVLGRLSGGHAPLAALVLTAALGVAAIRTAIFGRTLVVTMSAHFAATLLVVLAFGAVLGALVAGAAVLRVVGPRLVALERRFPRISLITRGLGARLIFAGVAIVILDALLIRAYVITPAAGLVAFVIAGREGDRAAWSRGVGRWRVRAFAASLVLATFIAPHALARLPGSARVGVVERPPFGSLILAAARTLYDRDHDGYSPILGGGDCDDGDASVHPGAHDVPGNGIDENCSGADAVPFTPPDAPPASLSSPASGVPSRPNVVVVVVDALRPDHLGFAGNPRAPSPAIDAFRETATWFRRAYTPAPSTRFALSSLFTGQDVESIPQRRTRGLDFELLPEANTLAEDLDRAGYDRVGFSIPHVLQHFKGMGQGFREWKTPVPIDVNDEPVGKDAPLTTDAALAYLATAPDDGSRPYFLFTHYWCTHWPYVRHEGRDYGPGDAGAYDSALAFCDEQIGRLLRGIDARPDHARTAVVLLSDHGELLGEHGIDQHGSSLLEPAVRSVLLVRIPGVDVKTVDAPVTLTDVHATLARLCGVPRGDARAWSLDAFLMPGETPTTRPIFLYVDDWRSGIHYQARGVVEGRFKFVRDLASGAEQVFDVETDPGELANLRSARPELRNRLSAWVDAWDPGVEFR